MMRRMEIMLEGIIALTVVIIVMIIMTTVTTTKTIFMWTATVGQVSIVADLRFRLYTI